MSTSKAAKKLAIALASISVVTWSMTGLANAKPINSSDSNTQSVNAPASSGLDDFVSQEVYEQQDDNGNTYYVDTAGNSYTVVDVDPDTGAPVVQDADGTVYTVEYNE